MSILSTGDDGPTETMPFALVGEIQLLTLEFSDRVYAFDTKYCTASAVIYPESFFKQMNP